MSHRREPLQEHWTLVCSDRVTTPAIARDAILVARCCQGHCTRAMSIPPSRTFYRGRYVIQPTTVPSPSRSYQGKIIGHFPLWTGSYVDTNFKGRYGLWTLCKDAVNITRSSMSIQHLNRLVRIGGKSSRTFFRGLLQEKREH